VTVTGQASYAGGSGELDGYCVVGVATGSTLTLRGVRLTGPEHLIIVTSGDGAGSTVRVIGSTIDVDGYLELTPGANAGDPLVDDSDVTLEVVGSSLTARGIILATSLDWPNGRTMVVGSRLTATDDIDVKASMLAGELGVVGVIGSTLNAGGDVVVATDAGGDTTVRGGSLTATGTVTVTTGTGGTCQTSGRPGIACS
jgi:hypothetical protein